MPIPDRTRGVINDYFGLNLFLLVVLLGPSPRGFPGYDPDGHFPLEIDGYGPIPARTRGGG